MTAITNYESFRAEARYQRFCAMCGSPTPLFDPHHVVYEQHLRGIGPKYDTRNVLRLCADINGSNCHAAHHARRVVVPIVKLTDDNIFYAFRLMGERAADYFRRYYDGDDERLYRHQAELASLP